MSKYLVSATAKHSIKLKGNWYKIGETIPSELSEEEYKFAKDALNIESAELMIEKSITEKDLEHIKNAISESVETSTGAKIAQVEDKPAEQPIAVEKPKPTNKPTVIKRPDTSKAKPRKTAN